MFGIFVMVESRGERQPTRNSAAAGWPARVENSAPSHAALQAALSLAVVTSMTIYWWRFRHKLSLVVRLTAVSEYAEEVCCVCTVATSVDETGRSINGKEDTYYAF
jgi:hypothetical protein